MASTAASPSVYSPPSSRQKRSASITSMSDYAESPPVKKKATTSKRSSSSAADKEYKKEERMERNRKAAQASRDRKKLQQEGMEARIADLERQLAAAQAAATTNLDRPLPPRRATSSLEEENESLRTQLQLEQLQSATLKVRLGALETKFSRLDELLRGDSATSVAKLASPILPPLPTPPSTYSLPSLPTPPAPIAFPFFDDASPAAMPSNAEQSSKLETSHEGANDNEKDSLRLVAREVDSSLPRKLSQRPRLAPLMTRPSSLTPSSSSPMARTPSTPTLHQILSSISINPPPPRHPSTTTSPSPTPGTIGRLASTSAPALKTQVVVRLAGSSAMDGVQRRDLGARRLNTRRRSRRTEETTEACSRSSRMRRFQLFVRR